MKPRRTLGLSLAILTSAMLFSLLPLLQIAALYLIQYRVMNMNVPTPDGQDNTVPFAVGGELIGLSNAEVVFQIALSIAFLIIAVMAWRGRPRWIRAGMIGAVLVLLAITIITSAITLNTSPTISAGMDSGQDLNRSLVVGRMVISVLVALYVLWYMNRGPARAFYRGYYLQRDEQAHESG